MRGKGQRPRRGYPFGGITPAHAGKRGFQCQKHGTDRDHPRTCGEKLLKSIWIGQSLGSPPRMRGKVVPKNAAITLAGITPAHAGKSSTAAVCCRMRRDHPRACGEKSPGTQSSLRRRGSPPRMRGKESGQTQKEDSYGITPAHAGKSDRSGCEQLQKRDHPRACGEKTKKIPYHRLFPLRSAPFSFSFA